MLEENILAELKKNYLLPKKNLLDNYLLSKNDSEKTRRIIDLSNAKKIHASLKENKKNTEKIDENEKTFPPYEITTYRSDDVYDDHRRPKSVSWGKSITDDLERRDFTINALAITVKNQSLNKIFEKDTIKENYLFNTADFNLVDLHQGISDLAKKQIRTVGNPDERFKEDALRMIRAIRLAVELSMDIEQETFQAIQKNQALIKYVSFERIRDEFLRILIAKQASTGVLLLDETGLLEHILPELKAGKKMNQPGHHTTDVWQHSLDSLANCPSEDPIVRLSALLHDLGKTKTYAEKNGQITFYNHDIIGSRLASQIAKRLRLSKKDIQRVFILTRYHMFHYQPEQTDAAIRRFMRKVGLENIDDILDLREGDRLGSGAKKTSWRLEEMKERIIAQLNQPMSQEDLAIDGHVLIKELNLKPGPILGKILKHLLELVIDQPELNNEKDLLLESQKFLSQNK